MATRTTLPDKLFFKIGEVADLVGVKSHVLRYWESEFTGLRPMKTRGSHRVYRRRDVELAMIIRRLIHDEGFTVSGAKKRLRELGVDKAESKTTEKSVEEKGASREVQMRAELIGLRSELTKLLADLDGLFRVAEVLPPPPKPEKKETRFERELRFAEAQAKIFGKKSFRRV